MWAPHAGIATARRNVRMLVGSMVVTFIVLRTLLSLSPNSDFNILGYNIHHLFTGLVLITAGGIPLAIFRGTSRRLDLSLVVFGVGLAMALDEWVYLITTDGSNASYLLPISFRGGVAAVALATGYCLVLVTLHRGRPE